VRYIIIKDIIKLSGIEAFKAEPNKGFIPKAPY